MILNLCLFIYLWSFATAEIIVKIPDGKLLGRMQDTSDEKNTFYSFEGIPYASPPLGPLRFQAPVPPKPWPNVLKATANGMACIEIAHYTVYPKIVPSDEDCLFVNVFTPTLNRSAKKAVLFWIYGGRFIGGNANRINYGPDYFMDQDVILVTFNYRMGPFGFLSTGDTEILGNAGLKDQVMALNWTKNNVEYFGGDPTKITIFGESSGGMSVGLHLLSNKSSGLFKGAICHSGCSLSCRIISNPKSVAYELATAARPEFNWNEASTRQVKTILTLITAMELYNLSQRFGDDKFVPTLEIENESAFLSEPIFERINSGEFNKVPLIIGQVSEESLGFLKTLVLAEEAAEKYDKNVTALIPVTMTVSKDANLEEIGHIIKQTYVGNGSFSNNIPQLLNYESQRVTRANLKQSELQSQFSPVYMYMFSFYGCKSLSHYTVPGAGKVGHFDDLPYFFKMDAFPCNEVTIRKKVTTLWSNFAKFLNPTPKKDDLFDNITWKQATPNKMQYFNIDKHVNMVDLANDEPQKMWNYIYENYAVRPFIVY